MSLDVTTLVFMLFVRFSFFPLLPQSKQRFPLDFLNTLHISLLVVGNTEHSLWQLILAIVASTLTATFAVICFRLFSMVCFPQRMVITGEHSISQAKHFVGKPLLFPNTVDHWRYFPKVIHFKYSYFVVGIPVGLRARVGRVLSIDEDHCSGSGHAPMLWDQCWFNIDQENYLNGDIHPLGLRGKLDSYLKTEGQNPSVWPYAYLVSTPRFLCSKRNIVSWWFLYTESRELDALIFEVNNSFDERKIVFLRFKGATKEPKSQTALGISAHPADGHQLIHFHHSESKQPRYTKPWKKDLFISPFNDTDGNFTTEVSDPCIPGLSAEDAFYSNVTLFTSNGRRKMNGEVRSLNDPIDPRNERRLSFAWFLARWACISTLSVSRIHFQAFRAFMKAPLKYYHKPEPRPTNLPRQASELERFFEHYFRLYLGSLSTRSRWSIEIEYVPPNLHYMHSQTFRSTGNGEVERLDIHIISPAMYTKILHYPNARTGFIAELVSNPSVADIHSQYLSISDQVLFEKVLDEHDREQIPRVRVPGSILVKKFWIAILRCSKSCFMDEFVSTLPAKQQQHYWSSLLRYWMQKRFWILGSPAMLSFYTNGGQIALMGKVLGWVLYIFPFGPHLRDISLAIWLGGYILLYQVGVLVNCLSPTQKGTETYRSVPGSK